jgi:purine nucleoside phosphorylase
LVLQDYLRWNVEDPLLDPEAPRQGARYPCMQPLGEISWEQLARQQLARHDATPPAAVVAVLRQGHSSPTHAELRAFRSLGGDVLLEAGAAEAVAARQTGMGFLGLALVLDHAEEQAPDPAILALRAEEVLPDLATILPKLCRTAPPNTAEMEA